MRRCVILSAVPVGDWAKKLIRPDDYLIACDAGWKNAERLGVQPDLILGDFDSSQCPKEKHPIVLPVEKDDTDTHYAARLAATKGFAQVLMLGVLGGLRFEHSLANLSTGLWLSEQGAEVCLADEYSRIFYVLPDHPVRLDHDADGYFSVFPMEGRAEGVTVTGAKYPVENGVLSADYPIGVSNETLPGGAEVSVQKGSLVLICTHKDH